MSCELCETEQEKTQRSAYYRWKNANIEVRGCDTHLREMFSALNNISTQEAIIAADKKLIEQLESILYVVFGYIRNGDTMIAKTVEHAIASIQDWREGLEK